MNIILYIATRVNKVLPHVTTWDPPTPFGGNGKWCNHCKKQYGEFSKT